MNVFPTENDNNAAIVKRAVCGILLLFTCCMIFWFSSQSGDESAAVSGGFSETVCEVIVPDFSEFNESKREEYVENTQIFVRKGAHFSEYMLLSFFAYGFFSTFKRTGRFWAAALTAVVFCFAYALTDEFHQYFISGRNSALTDVFIDTGGAIAAVLTAFAAHRLKRKKTDDIKRS